MCKSSFCGYVLLGPWKWRAVYIYGRRHHWTRGCHPCCVYSWEKWVSQTLPTMPCEKISLVSGTWSKEPLPSWRETVPWWTSQWTLAELLPTNLTNLHGWCGNELWKDRKKCPGSKTTQKCWCFLFVLVVSVFHYSVLSCLFWCAWSMQVVVPWNETHKCNSMQNTNYDRLPNNENLSFVL